MGALRIFERKICSYLQLFKDARIILVGDDPAYMPPPKEATQGARNDVAGVVGGGGGVAEVLLTPRSRTLPSSSEWKRMRANRKLKRVCVVWLMDKLAGMNARVRCLRVDEHYRHGEGDTLGWCVARILASANGAVAGGGPRAAVRAGNRTSQRKAVMVVAGGRDSDNFWLGLLTRKSLGDAGTLDLLCDLSGGDTAAEKVANVDTVCKYLVEHRELANIPKDERISSIAMVAIISGNSDFGNAFYGLTFRVFLDQFSMLASNDAPGDWTMAFNNTTTAAAVAGGGVVPYEGADRKNTPLWLIKAAFMKHRASMGFRAAGGRFQGGGQKAAFDQQKGSAGDPRSATMQEIHAAAIAEHPFKTGEVKSAKIDFKHPPALDETYAVLQRAESTYKYWEAGVAMKDLSAWGTTAKWTGFEDDGTPVKGRGWWPVYGVPGAALVPVNAPAVVPAQGGGSDDDGGDSDGGSDEDGDGDGDA